LKKTKKKEGFFTIQNTLPLGKVQCYTGGAEGGEGEGRKKRTINRREFREGNVGMLFRKEIRINE
jgi:hypothetical protein